jgi:hypothetical protein
MLHESTVEYEWHIPDRVYIIRMNGIVTASLMDTALRHVLGILNETKHSKKVHLIYHIEKVHLEAELSLAYIFRVTAQLYRHRNTASMVSVIGLNRLHAFLADSAGKAFSRDSQQGQAVATLNEALKFIAFIDPSLPLLNV